MGTSSRLRELKYAVLAVPRIHDNVQAGSIISGSVSHSSRALYNVGISILVK